MLEKDFTGFDSSLGLLEKDFALGSGGLLEKDFTDFDSSLGLLDKDFTLGSGDSSLEKVFTDFASGNRSLGKGFVGFSSLGEGNVSFTNSSSSSSSSSTGALTYSDLFATCRGISSKLTRIIVVDSFGLDRINSLMSSSEPSLFSNINLILNTTSSTSKLNIQFSASSLKESNNASS